MFLLLLEKKNLKGQKIKIMLYIKKDASVKTPAFLK
jgi:hypothetical protein